tara:strand:- start:91 stop:300 length:210 start_codon:yes stop_codon:yes gene_type:complete
LGITLVEMKLDQFIKWEGLVSTGGEAKSLILAGLVKVNNQVETRRGRKLKLGDLVLIGDKELKVKEIGT